MKFATVLLSLVAAASAAQVEFAGPPVAANRADDEMVEDESVFTPEADDLDALFAAAQGDEIEDDEDENEDDNVAMVADNRPRVRSRASSSRFG